MCGITRTPDEKIGLLGTVAYKELNT
jgi:hypothetical protein